MYDNNLDERTLEMAAKYICTMLDGLCPMVVEKTHCRTTCDLDTLPWQCWIDIFGRRPGPPKTNRPCPGAAGATAPRLNRTAR